MTENIISYDGRMVMYVTGGVVLAPIGNLQHTNNPMQYLPGTSTTQSPRGLTAIGPVYVSIPPSGQVWSPGSTSFIPTPNFSYSVTAENVVSFLNLSSGPVDWWQWNFGDGSTDAVTNPVHLYLNPGTYLVNLSCWNQYGSQTTSQLLTLSIAAPGQAGFIYKKVGLSVQFYDASNLLNAATFYWDFGDGSASTETNPAHEYAVADSYTVVLLVNGVYSSSQSVTVAPVSAWEDVVWTDMVNCYPYPNSNDLRKNAGTPYVFDAGAISTQTINSAIASAGIEFKLQGGFDSAAGLSADNPNQHYDTIDFCMLHFAGDIPATVIFENDVFKMDLGYLDPTDKLNILINGSGRIEYYVNDVLQYTSLNSPSFPLFMDTSIDIDSLMNGPRECKINIVGEGGGGPVIPAAASFTTSVDSGPAPLTVTFTDTSIGDPTLYLWNFGDGSTSTSASPSHTFTSAGIYTVSLTVADDVTSSTTEKMIVVTAYIDLAIYPPIASFTMDAQIAAPGTTINFTDTSTGSGFIRHWDFGDGATSSSQNPSHSYTDPGTYTITLTVTSTLTGLNTSASQGIIINADVNPTDNLPVAVIVPSYYYGTAPLTVDFTATVSTPDIFYAWNFGDGVSSTATAPSHTYTIPGTYTITLTVNNVWGSTTSSVDIVVMGATFSYGDTGFAVSFYTVDRTGNRVLMFDDSGAALGSFGGFGTEEGEMIRPTTLTVVRPQL